VNRARGEQNGEPMTSKSTCRADTDKGHEATSNSKTSSAHAKTRTKRKSREALCNSDSRPARNRALGENLCAPMARVADTKQMKSEILGRSHGLSGRPRRFDSDGRHEMGDLHTASGKYLLHRQVSTEDSKNPHAHTANRNKRVDRTSSRCGEQNPRMENQTRKWWIKNGKNWPYERKLDAKKKRDRLRVRLGSRELVLLPPPTSRERPCSPPWPEQQHNSDTGKTQKKITAPTAIYRSSSYEQSSTKGGTTRSSAIEKGKMNNTNKKWKIIFLLESKQDYSFKT
jgi:hypothetical protein